MKKRNKKLFVAACAALAAGAFFAAPVLAEAATVTLETNGGQWLPGKEKYNTFYVGENPVPVAWNDQKMKRTDYYLKGYNTRKDGKGTFYYPGEKVSVASKVPAGVTKFPVDLTRLYAQWEKYKPTKTVNLSEYEEKKFTNSNLDGYYLEGAEVYKKGSSKYLTASFITGNTGTTQLVKYNYDTGKATGVKRGGKYVHSNAMAYGNNRLYIAPGEWPQNNYVFEINEADLQYRGKLNLPNNGGVVDDGFTSLSVAYDNGKLFVLAGGGRVCVYNMATKKIENQFFAEGLYNEEKYNQIQGMAVNGNRLYVASFRKGHPVDDQRIFVYDYTAKKGNVKKEEWAIKGTNYEIEDISFVDGKMYIIAASGTTAIVYDMSAKKIQNGWRSENGKFRYYKDGKYYTGWHKMGKAEGESVEHWSYFGKDGFIYTGWHKMGKAEGENTEHYSYFGDNGWLRTGWQHIGKGTKNPDGNAAPHYSYFGDNGWLRTGWQQMGKGTKNPDGNAAKHFSYFGGNGWLRTGIQNFPKTSTEAAHQSYFGNDGWLRVNTSFTVANTKYRADARGWLTRI